MGKIKKPSMGKKIKITESTLSRIIERMVNEQSNETDIATDLRNTLETWETKEYESDESRWKEYYKDIETLYKKYKS